MLPQYILQALLKSNYFPGQIASKIQITFKMV